MQDLQEKLDRITSNTRRLVQPERLAISEQATADLFATGIEDRILPVSAAAPSFSLVDASTGKSIRSADLLALGPLILNFFRGRWCPYCVTELETWRDLYPAIRRAGAVLAAVSPQNRRQNAFTAEHLEKTECRDKTEHTAKSATAQRSTPLEHTNPFGGIAPNKLPFPILSDPDAELAIQFGIAHTIPRPARAYFRSILVNIPFANSGKGYDDAPDSAWRLPMPATFVIRQDATIAFAEAHADFRVRPEPVEILDLLAHLIR